VAERKKSEECLMSSLKQATEALANLAGDTEPSGKLDDVKKREILRKCMDWIRSNKSPNSNKIDVPALAHAPRALHDRRAAKQYTAKEALCPLF
jgi:hypothetical protein